MRFLMFSIHTITKKVTKNAVFLAFNIDLLIVKLIWTITKCNISGLSTACNIIVKDTIFEKIS